MHSYTPLFSFISKQITVVRAGRIELPSRPWQGRVLPLNHARNFKQNLKISSANYSIRTLLFPPEKGH